MADLTTHSAWRCSSNIEWDTEVQGSGGATYVVSWDDWQHQNPNAQYDYSCTCNAYKYGKGKHCKHIKSVNQSGLHCQWDSRLTGEEPIGKKCPCCGEDAFAYSYGA